MHQHAVPHLPHQFTQAPACHLLPFLACKACRVLSALPGPMTRPCQLLMLACCSAAEPGTASEAMMLAMSAGRISASVRGVLVTTVFHTCRAAARTVYPTSLRAMYTRAKICPAPPKASQAWPQGA